MVYRLQCMNVVIIVNVAQLAYHLDCAINVMFSFYHIILIPISILILITYYIIQS